MALHEEPDHGTARRTVPQKIRASISPIPERSTVPFG